MQPIIVTVVLGLGLWLGQRWLDRRARRSTGREQEQLRAYTAYFDAVDRMLKHKDYDVSAHAREVDAVEVLRAWARWQELAVRKESRPLPHVMQAWEQITTGKSS